MNRPTRAWAVVTRSGAVLLYTVRRTRTSAIDAYCDGVGRSRDVWPTDRWAYGLRCERVVVASAEPPEP